MEKNGTPKNHQNRQDSIAFSSRSKRGKRWISTRASTPYFTSHPTSMPPKAQYNARLPLDQIKKRLQSSHHKFPWGCCECRLFYNNALPLAQNSISTELAAVVVSATPDIDVIHTHTSCQRGRSRRRRLSLHNMTKKYNNQPNPGGRAKRDARHERRRGTTATQR